MLTPELSASNWSWIGTAHQLNVMSTGTMRNKWSVWNVTDCRDVDKRWMKKHFTLTQGRMCVMIIVSLLSSGKFSQNSEDKNNHQLRSSQQGPSVAKYQCNFWIIRERQSWEQIYKWTRLDWICIKSHAVFEPQFKMPAINKTHSKSKAVYMTKILNITLFLLSKEHNTKFVCKSQYFSTSVTFFWNLPQLVFKSNLYNANMQSAHIWICSK